MRLQVGAAAAPDDNRPEASPAAVDAWHAVEARAGCGAPADDPHLAGNALRHAPAAEVRRQGGDNEVGRAGGHRYQATVAAGGRIRGSLPLLKLVDGAHRRGHHRRRQREIRRRAGPVHPLDVRRVLQGVEEAVDPHDAPELRLVLGPRPRRGVARQLPGAGRVALAGGSVDDEPAPMRLLRKPAGGAGGWSGWPALGSATASVEDVGRELAPARISSSISAWSLANSGVPGTGAEDDEAAEEAGRAGGNFGRGCRFTSGGGTAGAFFTGGAAILA